VFVLPHAPLMGASGSVAASAVAGGLLSMARTLAIELARDAVTVNTVAVDATSPPVPGLSAQLRTLLGSGGETITGQEIYLTAGSDLGRLRP
jgi:NAD(P)-dependent dehydrogenase (short-subunit alcohol dehydrogenase family)